MNLPDAFELSVRRHPSKTALFWGDEEYSYVQLSQQAAWIAGELRSRFQVTPSDRVGLWLRNCPAFVPGFFGILQTGAIVVPINNFLKPAEVAQILTDAGISTLITDSTLAEGWEALAGQFPNLRRLAIEEMPAHPEPIEPALVARREDDLAVLIFTSGTTGRSKGAMLSHGNLLHNVNSCRQVLETVEGDRIVVLLPLFHSFMLLVGMLLPLLVGGSMVLVRSLHPLKNVLQEIIGRQATILPSVPQFFRTLTHAPVPPQFPLRLCISGGAPLPAEILKEFTQKFPIPLLEGYGLSEASPVVSFNPIRGPWKAGSIGLPVPGVEVSVQSEEGKELSAGEVGEICVRGGNVMAGYWNQSEATAQALRDGWLLTGDIGYRDDDGYYFITDRKKDMLLVNGINVYPREIEEIIYQFPGVREAAVLGRPDPRKGELPVAFISVVENATVEEEALLKFLRSRLADYKVPRQVHFLPALPRTATGKILKISLRERLGSPGEDAPTGAG